MWKKVSKCSPEFQKMAGNFAAQLQASVQPSDALQGLLLDRIAASYLRKQLLLEREAVAILDRGNKEVRPNERRLILVKAEQGSTGSLSLNHGRQAGWWTH